MKIKLLTSVLFLSACLLIGGTSVRAEDTNSTTPPPASTTTDTAKVKKHHRHQKKKCKKCDGATHSSCPSQ